jgi:hypothetical protein
MLEHDNGASFLVAVQNAGTAAPVILDYGVGVMAVGGFSAATTRYQPRGLHPARRRRRDCVFLSADGGSGGSEF